MRRLARFCYRHRRLVLGTWVLVLAGLLVLANLFGGVFKVDFALPGSESQRAIDILEANGFGSRAGEQAQVVFEAQQGVDDPQVQQAIEQFLAEIPTVVDDVTIVSPYSEEGARQIASQGDAAGKVAYAELNFADRESSDYADDAKAIDDLRQQIAV